MNGILFLFLTSIVMFLPKTSHSDSPPPILQEAIKNAQDMKAMKHYLAEGMLNVTLWGIVRYHLCPQGQHPARGKYATVHNLDTYYCCPNGATCD